MQPLGAPLPDSIPPTIASTDYQAQFNVTGCRVPTVVVSPYSRPNAVSNVPHDHTSIIATIAAKWNLPALTYRDAQANTLFDYVNFSGPPAFAKPPTLAAPALPAGAGGSTCVSSPPPATITPSVIKKSSKSTAPARSLGRVRKSEAGFVRASLFLAALEAIRLGAYFPHMSRFKISRSSFIRNAAGAATLGLAACAGGSNDGGTPAVASPAETFEPKTADAGPTRVAGPFPSGSVSSGTRGPNSLPDSSKPAGTVDAALPFDTVVIVMMENHSFDNYFGMLPKRGQPLADGFTFDGDGNPTNKNPYDGGYQRVFRLPSTCQPNGVNQDWDATHLQINGGAMNMFPQTDHEAMGYWDEPDIPFYYSLAKTFCLGNRAFCSAPAQTYPNRRFLYSGTALGTISSSADGFELAPPANGTLMDTMSKYGVTWMNYFSDLPCTVIIKENLENHPANYAPVAEFFAAAAAGTLPNVCFVDPDMGAIDDVGGNIDGYLNSVPNLPAGIAAGLVDTENAANAQGQDEENPQDISLGEAFVAKVVNAVMQSPQWPRTLLVWTYDEHGGYYDHVPPLAAVKPDAIAPMLSPGNRPGDYGLTGIRIPTVVVSPYSRPNAVSNVPHDHTSIIATIAAKWNLPALTYRDAQARTLFDYLNLNGPPAFLTPPVLAQPKRGTLAAPQSCTATAPPVVVSPGTESGPGTGPGPVPVRRRMLI